MVVAFEALDQIGGDADDGKPRAGAFVFDEAEALSEGGLAGPVFRGEFAGDEGGFLAGIAVGVVEHASAEKRKTDGGKIAGRVDDHRRAGRLCRIGVGAAVDFDGAGVGAEAGSVGGDRGVGNAGKRDESGKKLVVELAAGFGVVVAFAGALGELDAGNEDAFGADE